MPRQFAGDHLRDTGGEKSPRARSAEIVKQPPRTLRLFRGRRPRLLELPNWQAVATMEDRICQSGDAINRHDIACLRASLMKRERNDGNTNRVSTPLAATCPLTRLASTYWDLAASSDDNFREADNPRTIPFNRHNLVSRSLSGKDFPQADF